MLTRDRFLIPRRLLPSIMLLGQTGASAFDLDGDVISDLRRTGLLEGNGKLTAPAKKLILVMIDAGLASSIDIAVGGEHRSATIWATSDAAVLGCQIENDLFELLPTRPRSLHITMAGIVGIGRRPSAPFAGATTVSDRALELAIERTTDASDQAIEILLAAGTDRVWADRLLLAHDHLRSKWSVSSVWSDHHGGHQVRSLAMLDAGPAGYWRLEPQSADKRSGTVENNSNEAHEV